MADVFADILNEYKVGEAPQPQALPIGSYLAMVDGPYKADKVGQNQTEVIDFQLKIMQPGQDVSAEDIAAHDGGVIGKSVRARFFKTKDALYRLSDFLEMLGTDKGTGFKEALANAPGKTVWINLTQAPSQDGTRMFSNIKSYAKV